MKRNRCAAWAISAALVLYACRGGKDKDLREGERESKRDVTCWTSFRQLDWFIAEKSYSETGTLAKIVAIKGLVRAAWAKASAAAKGERVSAADLEHAVSLPALEF